MAYKTAYGWRSAPSQATLAKRAAKRQALLDADDRVQAIVVYEGKNDFVRDLNAKLDRWGELSEAQIAAGFAAVQRDQAKKLEWANEAANAKPAPTGLVTVEGEVKTIQFRANRFGGAWKALVKNVDGWKVWTTVPKSLLAVVENAEDLKGATVRFTANLGASDTDKAFAFASHPRNAQVIKEAA